MMTKTMTKSIYTLVTKISAGRFGKIQSELLYLLREVTLIVLHAMAAWHKDMSRTDLWIRFTMMSRKTRSVKKTTGSDICRRVILKCKGKHA